MRSILSFVTSIMALAACGEGHAAAVDSARADSLARARQDSINRAQPGYIVDSILPMEEQLRRFRAGLTREPKELVGGEESMNALVTSFVRSLVAADTAELIRLTITRAEFAYLVFPESPFSRAPYVQSPDLVWMRHTHASGKGLKRLLDRFGRTNWVFRSWNCDRKPGVEGKNRVFVGCTVSIATRYSEPRTLSLFSSIIERGGRYKILSYDNAF